MGMFVSRQPNGAIAGRFAVQQFEGQEFLEDDHADMRALTLSDAKLSRLRELAAYMAYRMDAGFAYGGKLYQIDDLSQARIAALAVKAALVIAGVAGATWPQGFRFVAADNTGTPFDAASFVGFADAASNVVIVRRMRARAIKNAIVTAADAETLAAIDVSAGWD